MKKLILLIAMAIMVTKAHTQVNDSSETRSDEIQTLVGKNKKAGGYGSISIQYTEIENRDAFVFGAKGGVVIGHVFTIGLAGSGFFNEVSADSLSLAGGYGGFFFEPIIFPKFPVHISFPVVVGVGGAAQEKKINDLDEDDNFKTKDSDVFMVIEPGVEIELNVTRYFKFCLGGYYRYATGLDIPGIDSDVLKGFSGGVSLKFGRF
jgi:hypothetical protein